MITNFCKGFVDELLLAYGWVRLKSIDHPVIEFFDKEMGFSWRAYRNLGNGYTCIDSAIGPFMGTSGIASYLVAYDERGITYLDATNARWLPI